jgi:hypothetical protein
MLVSVGGIIVKAMALLLTQFCRTVTLPGTIAVGTVTTICVSLQLTTVP